MQDDPVVIYKATTLAMLRQRDAQPECDENGFMEALDVQWERMTIAQRNEIETWTIAMMAARAPS